MPMVKRFSLAVTVALVLVFVASTLAASSGKDRVRMRDDCDPATFNAVLGDGACVGNGDTTFDEFIAQVTEEQKADKWRFKPDDLEVAANGQVTARNVGGETHTFTEVAEFGGGIVDVLNQLSGNPVPRPECATTTLLPNGVFVPNPAALPTFVPSGGHLTTDALPAGTHNFQCCIHPWMRAVVDAGHKD